MVSDAANSFMISLQGVRDIIQFLQLGNLRVIFEYCDATAVQKTKITLEISRSTFLPTGLYVFTVIGVSITAPYNVLQAAKLHRIQINGRNQVTSQNR